jgi:uncharacterized oligopeptide transporter (OPT) family protein
MTPAPLPHRPYIPANSALPEMTLRALLVGAVLGIVFGASSLYLVLKVGLTVSASIPVAVISITLFRLLSKAGVRDGTILEHNIVQTTGSGRRVDRVRRRRDDAGDPDPRLRPRAHARAAGRGARRPARHPDDDPAAPRMIVNQHGILKYPEGTACAQVLQAGASTESRAAADPGGDRRGRRRDQRADDLHRLRHRAGVQDAERRAEGLARRAGMKLFGAPLKGGVVAAEVSPELLGVGYIIGPRIAGMMFAGGVLTYLCLIPLILFFGSGAAGILPPGTVPVAEMSAGQIRNATCCTSAPAR